jgi:MSHA biogenesis protein MshK
MAGHLTPCSMHCDLRHYFISALFFVLLGSNAFALAQSSLADPTRPPGIDAQNPDAFTSSLLQSVIIPKRGKPMAVIGGQQVMLGEMYGRSRLIRLTEHEAVLEGPTGIERLSMTPGIEKLPNSNSAATANTRSTHGGQKSKDKP